ncbi:MAG: aconitate hydratase [Pseudomonadota bacterium]|jgi:aconitate hydratase
MNNNISLQTFQQFSYTTSNGSQTGNFYSLPKLAESLNININKLPISIRIVLESVLRNYDDKKVTVDHIKNLANWQAKANRTEEIPFILARVVLQDFTGVPLLADLAAMRSKASKLGKDTSKIEPLVPVDLVVDHSVQIDSFANENALAENMALEFERNNERYEFMKWGMQAFKTFKVVPPGMGIVHQVNLEYLARGVHNKDNVFYPDTLVGTDSHTTMINGVGVVGWGVGGIEAEAAMLGQPLYFLTPDVVGVKLVGKLPAGTTATDLVLTITELLRKHKVVGKFVEFFGEGAESLSLPNRATIANMAPEYGATMGFFGVDEKTVEFFKNTGRTEQEVASFEAYFKAQGLFGLTHNEVEYTSELVLDLSTIVPSVAGPKRPQDRIAVTDVQSTFTKLFSANIAENGFGQEQEKLQTRYAVTPELSIKHGDILIAAITSCTNTSNPEVMLAAGVLAKKAVAKGLKIAKHIKTSLAPGSRIVTQYLQDSNLLNSLEALGFNVAAYGCTTCIGNAGDLTPELNKAIVDNELICAAVLSGNRNFEARIHANIKANFLASPPLVIAYAIAGNMNIDLSTYVLGKDTQGNDVYLRDIWPSNEEIAQHMHHALNSSTFAQNYKQMGGELWDKIQGATGSTYNWPNSTYIANPPFFDSSSNDNSATSHSIKNARILGIFGDSITTDHISPAGSIKETSPAGLWLQKHGVTKQDFNSYGARRGHHEVMMRGTFANVRIKNLMLAPKADGSRVEGGYTIAYPQKEQLSIYDAAMKYQADNIDTVIFAGEEYGTGSSRDWAAKGTKLLGVKAVIAKSFERIHRSNLIGMGVLPLQFMNGVDANSLGLDGSEKVSFGDLSKISPQQNLSITIEYANGSTKEVELLLRVDTPIEVEYFYNDGILPYVLEQLLA